MTEWLQLTFLAIGQESVDSIKELVVASTVRQRRERPGEQV
jgi:hypothetical protein